MGNPFLSGWVLILTNYSLSSRAIRYFDRIAHQNGDHTVQVERPKEYPIALEYYQKTMGAMRRSERDV